MLENKDSTLKTKVKRSARHDGSLRGPSRAVEQLTLDRDLTHCATGSPEVAELVYYGFWYHAKLDALMAFIREAQKPVSGEVSLICTRATSSWTAGGPDSLYDEGIATMEAAARTIRPTPRVFCAFRDCLSRVQAKVWPRKH